MSTRATPSASALVRRFPALADVPRVALIKAPTPVAPLASISPSLWIKRDDVNADPLGGNKVRALEFLLASTKAGDRVVTVGSAGSTHALAVAVYGHKLGARVLVGRWRQTMNETAGVVAERVAATAERAPTFRSPAEAYAWAWLQRLRGGHWIAAGGSTPLGVLGHVSAGLELVDQIDAGELPSPRHYARAAVFLASDDAEMITGFDLRVDAGAIAKYWPWVPHR